MSTVIVINPVSGGVGSADVRARMALAASAVDRAGNPAAVVVTERAGHARSIAEDALRRGVDRVIAWGGDGTINEIASALAFQGRAAIGVIPAGSGNGFARALGIDPEPARALRVALTADPRPVDIGELGGRLFVNVAGIGLDAHVAARFNRPRNRVRGLVGYALTTARALATYRSATYDIVADGERAAQVRALLVVFANGTEFGNRICIAPGARVDDGAIDLVVVRERSRAVTLWNMRRLLTGSIERSPVWSSRPVRHAAVRSGAPMTFHVDGEAFEGGSAVELRVHPAAILVAH